MYTQLEQRGMPEPPINVSTLQKMKQKGEPIACVTAYDASYAALVDVAGADLVLVGDSLGMVIQGHDTTVPVTVDDIIYHSRMVRIPGRGHAFYELYKTGYGAGQRGPPYAGGWCHDGQARRW
jgi:hypothetical protein